MGNQAELDVFTFARQQMVEHQLRDRGIRDPRVLGAMAKVPRHEFVAPAYRDQAYEDHPLPVGEGQTISQPYIVAVMLDASNLQPSDIVLEIGTGSGYQTALLAELVSHVYSVERIVALSRSAGGVLARLDYRNVTLLIGDGSLGFPDSAPYDAIVVSAAAPAPPRSLVEQLREDGRLIIPVGSSQSQELQLLAKHKGKLEVEAREGCRFVPLIGEQGYPPEHGL